MATLRVLSLNTWKNEGDYARRLEVIAAGLRMARPDILLLQESFRSIDDSWNTAQTLATALGYEHAYAPARLKTRRRQGGDVPSESGHAILVRGTIGDSARRSLPTTSEGGERIALLVRACVDGETIIAGCLHLSHLRGDDEARRSQLATILEHPWWHDTGARCRVLGGDANATIDTPALAWLGEHETLDITLASNPNLPSHPLPPRPGRLPRAIDHIWTVGPRGTHMPERLAHGMALDSPAGSIWASDHAAVWVELASPGLQREIATTHSSVHDI